MPEAAVAHHRDGSLLHDRRHRARGGERHAEAQDRVAEIERRQGREGMAADVARDMDLADLALEQLDRREHRPLGTADAEARRPQRQRPAQDLLRLGAAGACRLEALARAGDIDVVGGAGEELQQPSRSPPRRCTRPPSAARPCRRSSCPCRACAAGRGSPARCSRARPPRRPARRACPCRSRRSGRAPADG